MRTRRPRIQQGNPPKLGITVGAIRGLDGTVWHLSAFEFAKKDTWQILNLKLWATEPILGKANFKISYLPLLGRLLRTKEADLLVERLGPDWHAYVTAETSRFVSEGGLEARGLPVRDYDLQPKAKAVLRDTDAPGAAQCPSWNELIDGRTDKEKV